MPLDQSPIPRLNVESVEVHYQRGASMVPHYHDEACLVLILSGFVAHTEGRHSIELRPGSVLYLPPAQRHADVFGPRGARCVVSKIDPLWIHRLIPGFDGLTPRVTRDGHLYALGVAIYQEIKDPAKRCWSILFASLFLYRTFLDLLACILFVLQESSVGFTA